MMYSSKVDTRFNVGGDGAEIVARESKIEARPPGGEEGECIRYRCLELSEILEHSVVVVYGIGKCTSSPISNASLPCI